MFCKLMTFGFKFVIFVYNWYQMDPQKIVGGGHTAQFDQATLLHVCSLVFSHF